MANVNFDKYGLKYKATGISGVAAFFLFVLLVGIAFLIGMAFTALGLLALNAAALGFTVPITWTTVFFLTLARLLLLGSGVSSKSD